MNRKYLFRCFSLLLLQLILLHVYGEALNDEIFKEKQDSASLKEITRKEKNVDLVQWERPKLCNALFEGKQRPQEQFE